MEAKWDAIATKIMILTIIVVGVVGRRIVWKQYVAVHQHHQPWRHSQQPDPPRPGITAGDRYCLEKQLLCFIHSAQ